jgi:hypothetical protein
VRNQSVSTFNDKAAAAQFQLKQTKRGSDVKFAHRSQTEGGIRKATE